MGAASQTFDVIVAGGGASGTTAAIQAARLGARVLVVEETPWLGGMLTGAGVSALDGNDDIRSGLHREFVEALWQWYGGPERVFTGWVSRTLYEPKVGQVILRRLVDAEPRITLWLGTEIAEVVREGDAILGVRTADGREARAPMTIEATECGDVLALGGVPHRLGRESRGQTGEATAPPAPDGIVQDYTYCLTLRDHSPAAAPAVPAPPGYDAALYDGSIREIASRPGAHAHLCHTWASMISYGRLPNGRYMINWPFHANDHFAPELCTQTREQRRETVRRMKDHALGFLHYLQTAAGHPELGLDEEAYPTADGLPFIPYVRESRRVEAVEMLVLDDVVDRHANAARPLYRSGVAVGDYFIDHHHTVTLAEDLPNPLGPDEHFPPIQAVTVPLPCLIPRDVDGLIAAEKSIGVTHSVNGVTRLQPIVMNIGQAAGALAALAVRQGVRPREVSVRAVQAALLDAGALLMPFRDVRAGDYAFKAIHRVAVAGVMRGFDAPRRCEFRPEGVVSRREACAVLAAAQGRPEITLQTVFERSEGELTRLDLARLLAQMTGAGELGGEAAMNHLHRLCPEGGWITGDFGGAAVNRETLAAVVDAVFDPFGTLPL